MAHKKGLDGRYLTPTREECFNEFIKAIHALTIDESQRKTMEIESLKKNTTELENAIREKEKLSEDVELLKLKVERLLASSEKNNQ